MSNVKWNEGFHDALDDWPKRQWDSDYVSGWDAGFKERLRRDRESEDAERRSRERDEKEEERHRDREESEERRHREMQEAMGEAASVAEAAAEAAAEEQRYIAANTWKFEAEAKAARASELLAAGLFDEGLRLAQEALGETGRGGDPGNLEANLVAAWALLASDRASEARRYSANQIKLLRAPEYSSVPESFLQVLPHLRNDDSLLRPFLTALHEGSAKWNYFREYSPTYCRIE